MGHPEARDGYVPFLWYGVVVELGFASAMLAEPDLFAAPIYAPIQPILGLVAGMFLVGGALSGMALVGPIGARLVPVVLVAVAAPQIPLAWSFVRTGLVTGSVGFGVQLLALAYVAWATAVGRRHPERPYVLMVGAMQLFHGLGMAVFREEFQNRVSYAEFGQYLWLFSPSFLVAGAGLLLSEARRWRGAVLVFAMIVVANISVLVGVFATTKVWTGVLSLGVTGVVLLLAVSGRPALRRAPPLILGLSGIVAAWDLVVWNLPALDALTPVPQWSLMRQGVAVGLILLVVGYTTIIVGSDARRRVVAGAVGAVAFALIALTLGTPSMLIDPDPRALFGLAPDSALWPGPAAPTAAIAVGGIVLVAISLRPGARWAPHVVLAFATSVLGVGLLNLLAYMLDSVDLMDTYDGAAMRLHGAIALSLFSVGLLPWALDRVAKASVGSRVFAGLYVLMIVTLIRSYVADGALQYLAQRHPGDLASLGLLGDIDSARNILLALAVVAASWTGIVITRTVTLPLEQLRRAIQRTRAGERRVTVGSGREDEIGEVIRAFDRMTVEIADANESLMARSRELEQANERLRTMLQGQSDLGEAVVVLEGGEPVEWNDALSRITGRPEASLRGLPTLFDIVAPDRRAEIERLVRERAHDTYRIEFPMTHADGSNVEVEAAIIPLPDGSGRQMAIVRDVTDRNRAQRKLERLALRDDLTGLSNRTLFVDRVDRTIRAAARARDRFGIVYLDLDRFKEVNDAYGHAAGDRLLREVGSRLLQAAELGDTVARFGGDEFAILHPASGDIGALVTIADRIGEVLRPPFVTDGHPVYSDASVGLVSYPEHGADVDTLLRHADVAMYAAKRSGRPWSVYAIDDDPRSQQRLAMLSDLKDALEREALELHFQPKVPLRGGVGCESVEALLRWQHPRLGSIPPKEFIPLAEETGLIEPLSRWILRMALDRCRAWRAEGLTASVAVNFSMRSIRDPEVARWVLGALADAGVPASSLIVEVTESWMMLEPRRTEEVLARLAAAGVRVSIDDFGTGYSSLLYLQRLPVHELKIDARFVGAMLHDPGSEAIVRSTIDLGHALRLQVVAEGVEDQAASDALAARGCDSAQGFAIAPPMPYEDLVAWLRDHAPREAHSAYGGAR